MTTNNELKRLEDLLNEPMASPGKGYAYGWRSFWNAETYVRQATDDQIWASPGKTTLAIDGSILDFPLEFIPFKVSSALYDSLYYLDGRAIGEGLMPQ